MQSFPERVKELWNVWDIRGMILLSLFLQIILIIFGSRRKHSASFWICALVWSAYTSADFVATTALGNMARSQGDFEENSSKPSKNIQAFWVPFLLLHLGGSDTITAYSLEDNELWLRHFLALVIQVGVAFYVFLRSWNDSVFTFIAIPMFIAGIVKYGERTWVLRSSSSKYFRQSLLAYPEVRYNLSTVAETGEEILCREVNKEETTEHEKIEPDADYLYQADYLFRRFTYLFADLILDYYERVESYSIIHNKPSRIVFKLIEVELGFMYDVLYTKATLVYSRLGILLRCISFLSSLSALITFSICIDEHAYPLIDLSITYLLLVGAVVIEVYAFIVLICSDRTMLWLTRIKTSWTNSHRVPTQFSKSPLFNRKRWLGSMAQHDLISFCVRSHNWVGLSNCKCPTWEDVNEDLQALIFQQLLEKANRISYDHYDIKLCKQFLTQRGDYVLERRNCLNEFRWSTIEAEFDHSLLLWHIATNLCYFDDINKHGDSINLNSNFKNSKFLSDYILYLLVMCPFMLPKGIGEIRYRDTCTEFISYLELKKNLGKNIMSKEEAYKELLQVQVTMSEEERGDQNKSVLFHGCKLAKQLQLLESQEGWDSKQKWDMIGEVWVEMLAYAASHCGWREHAQQLGNGGELLTHVCLLMAHLGLSEQYQIQKQYIRRPEIPTWVRYTCVPVVCICYCCCCCLCIPIILGKKIETWVTKIRGNQTTYNSEVA